MRTTETERLLQTLNAMERDYAHGRLTWGEFPARLDGVSPPGAPARGLCGATPAACRRSLCGASCGGELGKSEGM